MDVRPECHDQRREREQPTPSVRSVERGIQHHEQQQRDRLRPDDEELPHPQERERAHARGHKQRPGSLSAEDNEHCHHDGERQGVDRLNEFEPAQGVEPIKEELR